MRKMKSPKPGKRRKFSVAEKLRIVREAAACTQRGDIEALLRREGIYSSPLAAWRKQLALHGSEALAERKPGRKPKQEAKDRRIAELEKRSARLEEKLALAEKLSDLQKSLCHSGRQSHDRRRALMDVIEELDDPHVPIAQRPPTRSGRGTSPSCAGRCLGSSTACTSCSTCSVA
ncbi:transposase [Sorangium sp. So ce542]|uniref:transposase n=1 Tax=Sorangium sp. So ce542 TaxID=3133316 RepID=UPI003F60F5F9